jgi:putative glutathione S-transferase
MGQMIDGAWVPDSQFPTSKDGAFQRPPTRFRDTIAPGTRFAPEAGRYHLYVSLACPWAHRTLIYRVLKGLQDIVSLSVVHWFMGEDGWTFTPGEGVVPDQIHGAHFLHEVYRAADLHYTGRVTVPVLWDRAGGTIVNNESAEIIRMFNGAFDTLGAAPGDYCPEALRGEIDALNERIYATVNNGVYRCGFARTQAAYDVAVAALFETLDWLEARLAAQPFLCGDRVTEADWRLFTTLVRFDTVYHGHFKCNIRRLSEYPALWDYTRSLYQAPGVAGTVDFGHIKRHYYGSHESINPTRIVPAGPILDFSVPGNSHCPRAGALPRRDMT